MMTKQYRGKQVDTSELEEEVNKLKEDRLKASEDPEEVEIQEALKNEHLDEAQRNWASRYGELRRHAQQKEDSYKSELEKMRAELEEAQKNSSVTLPTSKEELDKWREDHPEIAKVIETIASQKADKYSSAAVEDLKAKLKQMEEKEKQLTKESALQKVKAVHKDFDQLSQDPDFHSWVDEQGKDGLDWIPTAVYNSSNAAAAIKAITLFKAEKGLLGTREEPQPKRQKKDEEAAAAASISKSSVSDVAPDNTGDRKIWKDSEIRKMSDEDFKANFQSIKKAQREGRYRANE